MRFTDAPNAYGDPTIWVDDEPVFSRTSLTPGTEHLWPHIVRALTAGPTMESARVVVETLAEENRALHAKIAELDAANADLNGELTDLRRANG